MKSFKISLRDRGAIARLLSRLPADTPPGEVTRRLNRFLGRRKAGGMVLSVTRIGDHYLLTARGGDRQYGWHIADLSEIPVDGRSRDHEKLPSQSRRRILQPPGWRLDAFARFAYSHRTYSLIFEPTLRDLTEEHLAALAEGNVRKAAWAKWRNYFAFWSAAVSQLPVSLLRVLVKLWKAAGS